MKITKLQLRKIIREAIDPALQPSTDDIITFLTNKARGYHYDHSLDLDGDGIPDAPAIRELLQDDFLDNVSGISIHVYEDLIDRLSQSPDAVSEGRASVIKSARKRRRRYS